MPNIKKYKEGDQVKTKAFYETEENKEEKSIDNSYEVKEKYDPLTDTGPTGKYRKLSKEMIRIKDIIGEIAIDRLKDPVFIDTYNGETDKFVEANLTPLFDEEDEIKPGNEIGFLFATLHKRKEKKPDGTEHEILIGKAFPALSIAERLSNRVKGWDRHYLYEKFFKFYQDQIIESVKSLTAVDLTKFDEDTIKTIIHRLTDDSVEIPKMRIEIYGENPTTYRDLCNFGLWFNVPLPTQYFADESSLWTTAELFKRSYERSLEKDYPPFLEKEIVYSVNITLKEWREYFEKAHKDEKVRYYIYENFFFPNNAFKVVIPVNAYNVWQIIKTSPRLDASVTGKFIKDTNDQLPKPSKPYQPPSKP